MVGGGRLIASRRGFRILISNSLRHRHSLLRHSGARERAPGIHFSEFCCCAMDSGSAPFGASRNDDRNAGIPLPSRDGFPPGLMPRNPSAQEGVGNAGCPLHPQPRAQMKKAHELATTSPPENPAFPHANGFNDLWRALPRDRACLSPYSALTPKRQSRGNAGVEASGPHAFAVRTRVVVCRHGYVHRIPCPTFRDDREAPLIAGRDARASKGDLPDGERGLFLSGGLDEGSEALGVICPSGRWGGSATRLNLVAHLLLEPCVPMCREFRGLTFPAGTAIWLFAVLPLYYGGMIGMIPTWAPVLTAVAATCAATIAYRAFAVARENLDTIAKNQRETTAKNTFRDFLKLRGQS